jgi:hypothetical protein
MHKGADVFWQRVNSKTRIFMNNLFESVAFAGVR